MIILNVKLNSINKAKEFNAIASKHIEDIDLLSGRYIIDAKSIMGIFSLDLSITIELRIHTDDEKAKEDFMKFVV